MSRGGTAPGSVEELLRRLAAAPYLDSRGPEDVPIVDVRTRTGAHIEGRIESLNEGFLVIQGTGRETYYLPVSSVELVSLSGQGPTTGSETFADVLSEGRLERPDEPETGALELNRLGKDYAETLGLAVTFEGTADLGPVARTAARRQLDAAKGALEEIFEQHGDMAREVISALVVKAGGDPSVKVTDGTVRIEFDPAGGPRGRLPRRRLAAEIESAC